MGPHEVIAERSGVVASLVDDPADARRAVKLLDTCEKTIGAPLVDESERDRLRTLAVEDESESHWHAVLGQRDGEVVGYGGVTVPGATSLGVAVGDLAVARNIQRDELVADVLADVLEEVGSEHGALDLELWIRAAPASQVDTLTGRGYEVDRRLAVMGREVEGLQPVDPPAGVAVRSFRDTDADAVVDVLAAAYEGTPDAGWDRQRFDDKRELPWFDPDDLLLAIEDRDG
ncbi:MAG: hypothetical protein R3320_10280, partial [Nitriliruptorales bacterium]|nr:hypothetical protein [Nitriliruptorales bacterium]